MKKANSTSHRSLRSYHRRSRVGLYLTSVTNMESVREHFIHGKLNTPEWIPSCK